MVFVKVTHVYFLILIALGFEFNDRDSNFDCIIYKLFKKKGCIQSKIALTSLIKRQYNID